MRAILEALLVYASLFGGTSSDNLNAKDGDVEFVLIRREDSVTRTPIMLALMRLVRIITDTIAQAHTNTLNAIIVEIRNRTKVTFLEASDDDTERNLVSVTNGLQYVWEDLQQENRVLLASLNLAHEKLDRLEVSMATIVQKLKAIEDDVTLIKDDVVGITVFLTTNPPATDSRAKPLGDSSGTYKTMEQVLRSLTPSDAGFRVQMVKIDKMYDTMGLYDNNGDPIAATVISSSAQPSTE